MMLEGLKDFETKMLAHHMHQGNFILPDDFFLLSE